MNGMNGYVKLIFKNLKNKMIKKIKKNSWKARFVLIFSIIFWLFVWWYFLIWIFNNSDLSKKIINNKIISKKEIILKTSWLKISNDFNTLNLFWKVISNEIANIYPRRQWIVKDIFVDVWDEIYEGQALTMLLPPWVEGQSSSVIQEKRAKLKLAQDEYNNSKLVSKDSINLSQNLLDTVKNQQIAWIDASKQVIETARANLQIANWNLEKALLDKKTKLKNNSDNLIQEIEQAEISIFHIKQTVQNIITNWSRVENFSNFSSSDLASNFWVLDTSSVQNVIYNFRIFSKSEEKYKNNLINKEITDKINKKEDLFNLILLSNNLLNSTEKLLLSSSTSADFSKSDLNDAINSVHTLQTSLFKSKEWVEDAFNSIESFLSTEDQKITKFQNEVLKQKELFKSSEENLNVADTNKIKNISGAKKTLKLTKTQQLQKIEKAKNSLDSARASLQSELAKSGHTKVISPFSWIISKRLVEIWEMIASNKAIFELTWVSTSLSQKAKREIVFGLPEEYFDILKNWDEVEFFLVNQQDKIFKAIVTKKSSQIDWASHTIEIKAKIDDNLILPNRTSIRVKIKTTKDEIYKISKNAVKREDNKNYIWIKNPNEAKISKISINLISDDWEFADIQSSSLSWTSSVILDSDRKIKKYLKNLKKLNLDNKNKINNK